MLKRRNNAASILLLPICFAAGLQAAAPRIVLNEKEYFEGPGFFFLLITLI